MENESLRVAKQKFLRREILDSGYDPEEFTQFCEKLKGADIDNWTLEQISQCVQKFKNLQISTENIENQPVPQIERTPKDLHYIPCIKAEPTRIPEYLCVTLENPEITGAGYFFAGKPTFTVTTSPYHWAVSRQIDDFVWLRGILAQLYVGVVLPPSLPKKLKAEQDDKGLKKQQVFLQKFIDSVTRHELLKTSPFLLGFLKQEDERAFKDLKRDAGRVKKPADPSGFISLTGQLPCDAFEKKLEDKDISSFLSKTKSEFKKLSELSGQFMTKTTEASKILDEMNDVLENLEESQSLISGRANMQLYSTLSATFKKWSHFQRALSQITEEYLQTHFTYSFKEVQPFQCIIKEKDSKLLQFIKTSTKLSLKKEKLWISENTSTWGMRESESSSANALYNNKELAFSKMLYRETLDNERVKNEFAYLNHQIKQECARVFTGQLEDQILHFDRWARVFTEELARMHVSLGDLIAGLSYIKYEISSSLQMSLSDSEESNIYLARLIMGSISLACSSFIVAVYLSFEELRFFFMRLVIYMILADMLHSSGLLLPSYYEATCYIQAIMVQYSALSQIAWSLIIAVALYIGIVLQRGDVERYEAYFLVGGYLLPGLLAVIPAIFDVYGRAEGLCWISTYRRFNLGTVIRLVCFYGILIGVILCNAGFYAKVIQTVRQHLDGIQGDDGKLPVAKLVWFPLILMLCYLPPLGKTLADFAESRDEHQYALAMMQMIVGMSSGILNAVVYGFNGSVREAVANWCHGEGRADSRISMHAPWNVKYSVVHTAF